ncbi:ABC transporter ATP-binding protein [Bacillus sp. NPDC077027]|uniref:ABC transporter ATP-binding protein n=1 Tax=Bacillus sp. NPDC077027 TaxID=3390548 RepID=UPI003CFBD968
MKSILSFLKPYRLSVFFIVVLTFISSMLQLYLPTLTADIVDVGIVQGDIGYIWKVGGWMIGCSLLAILLTIWKSYLSSKTALSFGRDMRRQLFVHVEQFSLEEFQKIGTSSFVTRTTNDVKQVQDVTIMILQMMTRAPLMLIGGIILAVTRDAVLSLIFLASLPLLGGFIFLISRKAIPLFGLMQKKTDRLNLIMRESLSGIRVVRAFNRVEDEKQRFQDANTSYKETGLAVNRLMSYLFPFMLIIMNFTSIAIVWVGANRIDAGNMEVGNLIAFLQYATMILMALIMLSMSFIMVPRAQASAKRMNEVLSMEPAIKDSHHTTLDHDQKRQSICFDDVTFYYSNAEKPAVEGISFEAQVGETTAIIGSTGAGKTTLLQLMTRFYEVDQGKITINGTDIKQLPQEVLRRQMGYVSQKAVLFSGTIADNVRFGKQDASDEEIWQALQTAQAEDFVLEKEDGIHAEVDQGGSNLSGGQKQRLSIARALVRKPAFYLFDDSFSALDYQTDAKLRKALEAEKEQSALIIVAQRISTVKHSDKIIVLDEGKIAGVGTHDQLLRDNVIYQEIVASQEGQEVQ